MISTPLNVHLQFLAARQKQKEVKYKSVIGIFWLCDTG